MADLQAGSVSWSPLGAADAQGSHYVGAPEVGEPRYGIRRHTSPGADGALLVRLGFRGRWISARLRYVAASVSSLRGQIESDRAALANATFSVTVPDGGTYDHCTLESLPDGEVRGTGRGTVTLDTFVKFRQERPNET